TGELNNSRPNRQVRRLEFNQAMEDFKTMFPSMDYEVIECVLRSNKGAVDATIDQLLQMSIDDNGSDDSSDSDDSIPPEILERTLEPDSSDEEPPPVYSPPTYDMHIYDRKYPNAPPTPPPRFEAQPSAGQQHTRSYRNWNPPLLGNLPDDFLRILPQQADSIKSSQSSMHEPSSSLASSSQQATSVATASGASEQERKLKQYLEDERIALFLQNEEFMKELQRNREFLVALERDRLKYESKKSRSAGNSTGNHYTPGSFEACTVVSDDALFRDKLKHMGKSKAKFIGELLAPAAPFDQKSGRETWTVAFAPDGSYFAWSQGHRIVRLVPWSKCMSNFSVRKEERLNGSGPRRLSRQGSDSALVPGEPREHAIDCGDIVWGLAFGSSVPEKPSRCVNIEWHRFKFGQDQLLLATGLNNGRIKIWDVYTGKLLLNLMDHTDIVRDLTFAPDGSLVLVSASRDKTLRVWDLKDDGNMMKVLRGHQNWVYCSAFSPDSSVLCSVGAGKAVFLWDMDKYTLIRKLEGHHNDVVSCEFSPDGALLATASYDTRVIVWDPHTATILLELGHLFPPPSPIFAGGANDRWVRSVAFCHDGRHIASITDDRLVRFWSIDEKSPQAITSFTNGLCCAFSTDGGVLAAG
ncbi:WD repeat and SOCS box-containing protein 1, partial [Clarias magur]